MQQLQSPSPSTSSAPAAGGSTRPSLVAADPSLVARLDAWRARAQAAEPTAEAEPARTEALPEPDVSTGVIDDSLRTLDPAQLAEMGLDALVAYVDAVLVLYTQNSVEAGVVGGPPEEGTCEQEPAPLPDTETTAASDPYCSQMDNPQAGTMKAAAQCSATALTMGLLKLAETEDAFAAETQRIAADHGVTLPEAAPGQPEALLIGLMLGIDWDQVYTGNEGHFETTPTWREHHPGDKVIKSPYAQSYIASRYTFCTNESLEIVSAGANKSFDERWDAVLQAQQEGGQVSFEGGFTGSGHVVHITDMDHQGMVVHDPYGLCLAPGWYLRNGAAPGREPRKRVAERCGDDAERMAAFDARKPRQDWGRDNRFSRDELKTLGALQWALILRGA